MAKFTIEATHEDDIFDLELKQIHIAFKKLGIDTFPKEHIKLPVTNMDYQALQEFNTGLMNTWLKRNRSKQNLKVLKKALKKAEKTNA